jgi:hypothetical protein
MRPSDIIDGFFNETWAVMRGRPSRPASRASSTSSPSVRLELAT